MDVSIRRYAIYVCDVLLYRMYLTCELYSIDYAFLT